jgi:hypothetical protein
MVCPDGTIRINRIGTSGTMCIHPSKWSKFGIMELVENKPAYDEATQYLRLNTEGVVDGKWQMDYVAENTAI